MKHLVLFEDDPRFLESFLGRLRSNGGIKLHHFLPEGKFDPKGKHTVESLLYSWIRKEVPTATFLLFMRFQSLLLLSSS